MTLLLSELVAIQAATMTALVRKGVLTADEALAICDTAQVAVRGHGGNVPTELIDALRHQLDAADLPRQQPDDSADPP